jgi:hypothetical protein
MRRKVKFQLFNNLKAALKGFLILTIFVFIGWCLYLPFSKDLPAREFESVVTDKWIQISETQQGSYNHPKVLVKTDEGRQIKINLDLETYEKVRIGDRLKHGSGVVEIKR